MYFQHLYAKGVKLSDLGAMQRYLAAPTSLRAVNSVQKNHSIEDLTPVKLNARVKARIAQLHLEKNPGSNAVDIEDIVIGTSAQFMRTMEIDLRE